VRETQNRTYNHASLEEKVQESVKKDVQNIGIKPENAIPRAITKPSWRIDVKDTGHAAIHVIEVGYCIHDYIISPCTKFRDCINYSNHVYVKGDKDSPGRLEATAAYTEQLLEKAKVDMEKEYGGDKWAAYHEKTLAKPLDFITFRPITHVTICIEYIRVKCKFISYEYCFFTRVIWANQTENIVEFNTNTLWPKTAYVLDGDI